MPRPSSARTALVLFEGALALDVAGPAEVFAMADRLRAPQTPVYEPIFLSPRGGAVRTASGLVLETRALTSVDPGSVDTVIVSGGSDILAATGDAGLVDWVGRAARTARRTCSVCTGAFVLAAAGLLDGRRAVTHWADGAAFRARFPEVRLEIDPIHVRDGNVWTSAGVTAGIDLALALIEDDFDRRLAVEIAKQLVVFVQRPGGQAQFSSPLNAQSRAAVRDRDARLKDVEAWIVGNLTTELTVEALAARAGMAPRTFARLFTQATGITPAKAVEATRVEAACRHLEETGIPIKEIASGCGFGDEERMRRAFMRRLGVPPSTYRERFSSKRTSGRSTVPMSADRPAQPA